MVSDRIRSRVSCVIDKGQAYLQNKRLVFNKRSIDGSGKANLMDSPGDVTWGVLYEISDESLVLLDKIEGGYKRIEVQVYLDGDVTETAITYVSEKLTDDPVPYDWYKELVVSGAQEHHLPQEYLDYLSTFSSKPDESVSSRVG